MPEACYPHTWDACPLDDKHIQALAIKLLERMSAKPSTARAATEGGDGTAAKRIKASAQMTASRSEELV